MDDGTGYRHEPVMVEEVLEHLRPGRGGWFLDGTVGGGGHAAALLESAPEARLIGLDRDPEAVETARTRLAAYGDRVRVERANFRNAREVIEALPEVDEALSGALLDLGVSSEQIETTARGFSFRLDTPLDMRMGGTASGGRPAADFLNRAPEDELGRVFREYGEERRWRPLARAVVRRREEEPYETSGDLLETLRGVLGPGLTNQDKAKIFQALRIEVNDELGALEEGLEEIRELLAEGGRMVVIAYHSLEDRIVKNAFRDWSRECVCPPRLPVCRCRGEPLGRSLTSGPARPTDAEVDRNPRSRSARLRAWQRRGGATP
ncbi:MAG: 16S rRNA (cytosine(1402)-N(4))-methyltransferase RsmH [Gemmatimonadota bacterium]